MKCTHDYEPENDNYPEMTREAVTNLWNDDRYSLAGLKNIAKLLLKEISEH